MTFGRKTRQDDPEINLIPFIDILLVIIIFLMISTTFSQYSELRIQLPNAQANDPAGVTQYLLVTVTSQGQYRINNQTIVAQDVMTLRSALEVSKSTIADKNPMVVIHADSQAQHQSIINVMEAARLANLTRITFATQRDTR